MADIFQKIIYIYTVILFGYFLVVNGIYLFLIFISWNRLEEFVKIVRSDNTIFTNYTKPISILVPAYNEELTIIDNINSLLNLNYPEYEIIVINDGSKDNTLQEIICHFNLRKIEFEVNKYLPCEEIKGVYSSFELPQLVVIDKENGGKADSLNAGINVSLYPYFCAVDADSIIEKDALFLLVKPFLKYKETIAVGGFVRIANGSTVENGQVKDTALPKKMIEKFQIIEYFRAFLTSRIGWEKLNGLLIISGAFGLFSKRAVIEVGGYKKTIGEDMELTVRLHEHFRRKKKPYHIDFVSDAVCWTQAPDTISDLKKQRVRWHRGLADSLFKHIRMLFNPRYGTVGMLAMPYFFFIELLGPVIEVIGYFVMALAIYYGYISIVMVYIFLMAYLFGITFSFTGIFLEELAYGRYKKVREILTLFGVSLVEQFFYRQLTVFWRMISFFNFKKGSKQWGDIRRKSFIKK